MMCLLMYLFPIVPFRMQMWSLNTYLYGPKDDLKHRLLWREVYSAEEEGMCIHYAQYLFKLQYNEALG